MENWEEKTIHLGNVNRKTTVEVVFKGLENIKEISSISASCGCTTPVYNKKEKTLSVSFKTGTIPFHLRKQGFYITTKKITVTYTDNTFEELFINAKII